MSEKMNECSKITDHRLRRSKRRKSVKLPKRKVLPLRELLRRMAEVCDDELVKQWLLELANSEE